MSQSQTIRNTNAFNWRCVARLGCGAPLDPRATPRSMIGAGQDRDFPQIGDVKAPAVVHYDQNVWPRVSAIRGGRH
jgi:hypothetical protein